MIQRTNQLDWWMSPFLVDACGSGEWPFREQLPPPQFFHRDKSGPKSSFPTILQIQKGKIQSTCSTGVRRSCITISLSNWVGLNVTVVVFTGPDESTFGFHSVRHHIIDQTVLVPDILGFIRSFVVPAKEKQSQSNFRFSKCVRLKESITFHRSPGRCPWIFRRISWGWCSWCSSTKDIRAGERTSSTNGRNPCTTEISYFCLRLVQTCDFTWCFCQCCTFQWRLQHRRNHWLCERSFAIRQQRPISFPIDQLQELGNQLLCTEWFISKQPY